MNGIPNREGGTRVIVHHFRHPPLDNGSELQADVVLLDIGLPEMDGYEVARRMRQDQAFQDTVLVAVTGYGQESDRQQSREAGFDHHLIKPPDMEELKRILESASESRRGG